MAQTLCELRKKGGTSETSLQNIRSVVYGNVSGSATISCQVNDFIVVSFTNASDTLTFTGATEIAVQRNTCTYYLAKATATSVTINAAQSSRLLVAALY